MDKIETAFETIRKEFLDKTPIWNNVIHCRETFNYIEAEYKRRKALGLETASIADDTDDMNNYDYDYDFIRMNGIHFNFKENSTFKTFRDSVYYDMFKDRYLKEFSELL